MAWIPRLPVGSEWACGRCWDDAIRVVHTLWSTHRHTIYMDDHPACGRSRYGGFRVVNGQTLDPQNRRP